MTDDVLGIIGEGVKWLAVGGGAYLGALTTSCLIGHLYSDKIKNPEQLEKILRDEIKKLEIDGDVIGYYLWDDYAGHVEFSSNDGPHKISAGGLAANRNTIRHELYHIKKQHWKNRPKNFLLNKLDYFFRREPQAIAYELFGLKL